MKWFNQTGHPWRNPEDSLIRSKYDSDFVPPPHQKSKVETLLVNPESKKSHYNNPMRDESEAEEHLESVSRAENMDCVGDLWNDIKWPLYLGVGYGAIQSSIFSWPSPQQTQQRLYTSSLVMTGKSLMREVAYLKVPAIFMGGFAAIYSLTSCSVAKWVGEDGYFNGALGGMATGVSMGVYLRDPNRMFMFGVYGALVGMMIKHVQIDNRHKRPFGLTYHELLHNRKIHMSHLYKQEAPDGYKHKYLDPQLEAIGVKIPSDWTATQQTQ
ncbi:hypothetical protein MIR68_011240 [Amoeboaphelidium protococcarum]|nr:hypothetical protein MIR68_011240 [Amoeboaphelidium protococcarum]